ncbi:MAG: FMN-binding negative transcriptional regulator [Actinomycetales bacterium]|nr:FMN-binding negative transcriptional regulator [Actinomycetales bacterium]
MYTLPSFQLSEDDAWSMVLEAGAGFYVRPTSSELRSVFAPIVVDESRRTITTHVARANDWWREADGADVLVLVLAASAYVSPRHYPSKAESPGVVPTWNYVAAEIRGTVGVHDDATWTRAQVERQTDRFEATAAAPWRVTDAPSDFIDRQVRAIVGVSIAVSSIEGKAKLSQNRPEIDHDEVQRALSEGTLADREVARWMGHD